MDKKIEASSLPEQPNRRIQKSHLRSLMLVMLALFVLAAGYWWLFKRNRVYTDNAYVMADSALISSRVPGTISQVLVENDDPVKTGQTLLQLDPKDYQVLVNKARAALDQIEAEIEGAKISIPITETQTSSQVEASRATLQAAREKEREVRYRLEELGKKRSAAMADLKHAEREFERFSNLFGEGAGSERQRDQASTALKKARAQMGAIDAEIAAAKATLAAVGEEAGRARAQLQAAQGDRQNVEIQEYKLAALQARRDKARAELEEAMLHLSYCTITAPIDGYIAQKKLQVGERVQPGQPLLALVPLQDVYVEANYKETELVNVRLGQPAKIKADIYPGYSYTGKVVGIRAGTGAAFSLLPAENATGNWIKVVQRVPVKILLDSRPPADHPLRLGLSLEVTIDTSDRSGSLLVGENPKVSKSSFAQP